MFKYVIERPPLHDYFELPTREELLRVTPGDYVKVIFDIAGGGQERMWMKVTCSLDDHVWHGVLSNEPFSIPGEQCGSKIRFHPLDIIDVEWQGEEDSLAHLEELYA